jgi:hypothetical protein
MATQPRQHSPHLAGLWPPQLEGSPKGIPMYDR